MRLLKITTPCCLVALALGSTDGWCQRPAITVDLSHPGAKMSPMLYGIFFEEINHAGDGGLYAELIRNRTFEERTTLGWSLETTGAARARMTLDTSKPQNDSNKTSLRLEIMSRVVNFTEQLQTTAIKLEGASKIESEGTEILLTSESLEDTNTIEQPRKVAPVTRKASGFAPEFTRTFAPRSLTILRLKTAKASAAVRPIAQGTGR